MQCYTCLYNNIFAVSAFLLFLCRLDAAQSLVSREQAAVHQCREVVQKAQAAHAALTKAADAGKAKLTDTALALEEALQEARQSKKQGDAVDARNAELQEMCSSLSTELQEERGKRMELETKLVAEPPSSAPGKGSKGSKGKGGSDSGPGSPAGGGGGAVDREMLDMTLNMLRCFVCRDRFKNAVITRCYHLFCNECIDRNLKNRNRKCPACGEKFGSDDVKTVYFTH
jgi:E3 ubiquitin-protein ligase BRE1